MHLRDITEECNLVAGNTFWDGPPHTWVRFKHRPARLDYILADFDTFQQVEWAGVMRDIDLSISSLEDHRAVVADVALQPPKRPLRQPQPPKWCKVKLQDPRECQQKFVDALSAPLDVPESATGSVPPASTRCSGAAKAVDHQPHMGRHHCHADHPSPPAGEAQRGGRRHPGRRLL